MSFLLSVLGITVSPPEEEASKEKGDTYHAGILVININMNYL